MLIDTRAHTRTLALLYTRSPRPYARARRHRNLLLYLLLILSLTSTSPLSFPGYSQANYYSLHLIVLPLSSSLLMLRRGGTPRSLHHSSLATYAVRYHTLCIIINKSSILYTHFNRTALSLIHVADSGDECLPSADSFAVIMMFATFEPAA
jgi:hypothetical protein